METPSDWNRRRFLALAGGMTVLAGCAAEEIDDAEDADDEDDDVDEETDDVETDDDTDEDGEVDDPDEEADGEDDEDDSEESDGEAEGDDAESEDGEDDHDETDDSGEGEADSDESGDSDEDHADEGETDEESDGEDESDGEADDDEDDEGEDQTDDGDDEENDTSDDDPEEPPLSDISIRVVNPDGEPIEGATVSGEGDPHEADIDLVFDGETGDSGYHHNTIYENEYTVEIDHPDYESTLIEHTHDRETEVTVELEPTAEEPPTSEITIRVVDPDGNPVEGAEIAGQGEPHPADIPLEFSGGETDENGFYATPIYENTYTIDVDHPDYIAETVEHVHDGDTELTVELEPEDDDDDEEEGEPEITEYEMLEDDEGFVEVEGVVANNTGEELTDVRVRVGLYNEDGYQVDYSQDIIDSLAAGEEGTFEISTSVQMDAMIDYVIEIDRVGDEPVHRRSRHGTATER